MATTVVKCMHCAGQKIQKYGKKPNCAQRFKRKSCNKIFQDAYVNNGAQNPKLL